MVGPVAEDKAATLIPPGVFDAWWNATLATDPVGSKLNPPMLRAPNGVVEEFTNYWLAGKPYYDPGKITVPTLLIHAEWDVTCETVRSRLADPMRADCTRLREASIAGGHGIMLERPAEVNGAIERWIDEVA